MKERCFRCAGSGKVMGGGMMLAECDDCDGTGKVYKAPSHIEPDRDGKHYREAVAQIQAMQDGRTEAEARAIFDREYNKLKDGQDGAKAAGDIQEGGGTDPIREQCQDALREPDRIVGG